MRFLSLIRVAETGQKPTERLMNEMGKLIDEMTKNGTLVRTAGCGCDPTTASSR